MQSFDIVEIFADVKQIDQFFYVTVIFDSFGQFLFFHSRGQARDGPLEHDHELNYVQAWSTSYQVTVLKNYFFDLLQMNNLARRKFDGGNMIGYIIKSLILRFFDYVLSNLHGRVFTLYLEQFKVFVTNTVDRIAIAK